ncbi:anion transporter [Dissulfurirhabdus thermomarina]|uniref:Anion transporter n=1 Tax=Dissulfurirhabdus thermomarina TaxID=1765737 RepID=A0A6N9TMV3_DISTH|nr:anion transporter [Dissulfurirhabdus thermomarina]NDY42388.1 anion transporter [Dissulfurirhabdus thermomarina]NMX24310.1 anion transporter [Dissulfurirhabdus thermomarina]
MTSVTGPLEAWVFGLVYLGMMAGRFPRLRLDRTGIALLGAIVLVASGRTTLGQAVTAVDIPTVSLLFAMMVVSAQLRLGGFYAFCARKTAELRLAPPLWLAAVIFLAGILSAVFSNDIICLAMAPVLIDGCRKQRLDPLPFLLALACAANIGSAATLIGNPQNMLIGQSFRLDFVAFAEAASLPAAAGLLITWGVIVFQFRGRWEETPGKSVPETAAAGIPPLDLEQTFKGLLVASVLFALFLFSGIPREIAALGGAGVLLASRRVYSRDMLNLVDWQLLVLFIGLFVVNHAFEQTGLPARALAGLQGLGADPSRPGWLFAVTVLLSNAVSNVPAVMLLIPAATDPAAPLILAVASTLAGNLLLVGSIANIIVADAAARSGVAFTYRNHARTGVPVTLLTLAVTALFLSA